MGVASGAVVGVVEIDLMFEDEVVPKVEEIDKVPVLADVIPGVMPVMLRVLVARVDVVAPVTAGTGGVAAELEKPGTAGIVMVLMTIERIDELARPVVKPTGRRGLQKSGMTVTVLVTVSTVIMVSCCSLLLRVLEVNRRLTLAFQELVGLGRDSLIFRISCSVDLALIGTVQGGVRVRSVGNGIDDCLDCSKGKLAFIFLWVTWLVNAKN